VCRPCSSARQLLPPMQSAVLEVLGVHSHSSPRRSLRPLSATLGPTTATMGAALQEVLHVGCLCHLSPQWRLAQGRLQLPPRLKARAVLLLGLLPSGGCRPQTSWCCPHHQTVTATGREVQRAGLALTPAGAPSSSTSSSPRLLNQGVMAVTMTKRMMSQHLSVLGCLVEETP
jgi:hypothetical protein